MEGQGRLRNQNLSSDVDENDNFLEIIFPVDPKHSQTTESHVMIKMNNQKYCC